MTETVEQTEQKDPKALIATRSGKLGVCTRKLNETKALLESKFVNVLMVKDSIDALKTAMSEFGHAHAFVSAVLSEEEKEKDRIEWFEPKMSVFDNYVHDVEKWLHLKLDPQINVAPEDSVSRAGSKASSISSMRAKAEAEKAALAAKVAGLQQKHALELERAKLQSKMELIEIQSNIAATDAKLKVFENYEASVQLHSTSDITSQPQGDKMNEYFENYAEKSPFEFVHLGAVPKTPLQRIMEAERPQQQTRPTFTDTYQQGTTSQATSSGTMHVDQPIRRSHPRDHVTLPPDPLPRLQPTQMPQNMQNDAQNDLVNLVMAQQRQFSLQIFIPTFNGDLLSYRPFIQAFEHCVEDRTDSNVDRLYYLEQYTSGQPQELVRSCLHMDVNRGYVEAKRLLDTHFGNSYRLTTAYIEKALSWNSIKSEDGKELHSYALYLRSCCNVARDLPDMCELDTPSTLKLILSKLPYKLQERWRVKACEILENTQRRATFNHVVEFLERQAKILVDPVFGSLQQPSAKTVKITEQQKRSVSRKSFATTISPLTVHTPLNEERVEEPQNHSENPFRVAFSKPCFFCKGDHFMDSCHKMAAKQHKEKVQYLKDNGMCFDCLVKGHMSNKCKKRLTCQTCQKRHPTVLHIHQQPVSQQRPSAQQTSLSGHAKQPAALTANSSNPVAIAMSTKHTGAGASDCKLAIVPVKVKSVKGNNVIQTYAFLDSGSSACFCTEKLMEELHMEGRRTEILLRTMGLERAVNTYRVNGLEVSSLDGTEFIHLPEVFTQSRIPVSHANIVTDKDIQKWPYLKDVQLTTIKADIGLLIGANASRALEPWRIIHSQGDGPYAVKTCLGWLINGPLSDRSLTDEHGRLHISSNRISVARLEELLVNQYNSDFPERMYEEKAEPSFEDKKFLRIADESAVKKNGHYVMRLPFRDENLSMPNNKAVAELRAMTLRRKLSKNKAFHSDYTTFMKAMLDKGHAEKVPDDQLARSDGRVWYIPHHGVYHKKKHKIRVVFDCTASFQGTSLNLQLLQGPDLTNTLLGVILRYRQEPVAMMADIEGMFHQVRIPENDVDFLRFLWWPDGDVNKPLTEYRMVVHLFGAVSSPSCANYALKRAAIDNEGKVATDVLSTIKNNFYVDDCLKSVASEKQAIQLARELKAVCATGGFRLTKWVSNSASVLASIPEEDRALKDITDVNLEKSEVPLERALGVQWNISSDTLCFKVSLKQQPYTRRGILSVTNSVYDPLGFLAPLILPAKRMMQELCRGSCGWIPLAYSDRWETWLDGLDQLTSLNISRCYRPKEFGDVCHAQLHHFCDASEVGYGTASYLRFTNSRSLIHIAFVMGKGRVAPLKSITIPRLELAAAVLAVRINRMLEKELEYSLQPPIYWTDSTTVIKYILNDTCRFQTYVANRVSTIRGLSEKSQWRYVNSALNPADDASRGLTAEMFLRSEHWLRGPAFLTQPEETWPKYPEISTSLSDDDPEVKKTVAVFGAAAAEAHDPVAEFIEHFSSWNRLKRATARLLQFKDLLIHLSKKRKASALSVQQCDKIRAQTYELLSVDDLLQAEEALLRCVQQQHFQKEIAALEAEKNSVEKTSKLYKLDPYLQDGILRVGGRLNKMAMPEEFKHPAILPKNSHLTRLIIRHIHLSVGHGGRNQVMSKLRQKYWVVKANSATRNILKECVSCRRWHTPPSVQKMSDLPLCRTTPDHPPFTYVGVDYFGPIEAKRGRSVVKRYGVLFTCLVSRAIHLELAYSLDTDSCISALRRFMCRRGQVQEMFSHNGTNFVGAERELRESLTHLNHGKIHQHLSTEGIRWSFNPPFGSHHGGAWERLIRTIKKVLYSTVKQQTLDDESLQTVLCEIETILNDRPLTAVSDDARDPEALTPNHLLLLKGKPLMPPGVYDKNDCFPRRRWKQVQYISDLFWKRWVREYLPLMQERQKWNVVRRNLKPNDIVLIVDESSPRNSWPMGKVVETIPDSRGHVRRVKIQTKNNILERPITKLCLLLEA
ncbi:hypothetical protein ACEWY4_001503 [Coilia grayii]|uniref:Integrase catalytic domain-containing protein n=1 Tax=Coilia grayii TaxID=363190 RepID=A0ABD1KT56_9TELE